MSCGKQLGDRIEQALSIVGITQERVHKLIGNCGCQERKRRINQLSSWAIRVSNGVTDNALEYLNKLLPGISEHDRARNIQNNPPMSSLPQSEID